MTRRSRFWVQLVVSSTIPFLLAFTGVLISSWQTHKANLERDAAVRELKLCRDGEGARLHR